MPKAGIIYNDLKPMACSVAEELHNQLRTAGWEVCM
ncbi:MAG: NAD(+) kinase, partial [Moorea sp. SIO4G2]|nr:NAD(+) kinase [Moorena sp. SIO4G2]